MKFQNPEVEQIVKTYMALSTPVNLLLVGPPGTGKTMLVKQVARDMDREFLHVTGMESLSDIDVIGSYVVSEGNRYRWVDGPLTRAFRMAANGRKVVMLFDEINRMRSEHQNLLIGVINIHKDGYYVLHNHATGEVLESPRENLCIMAACNAGQVGTHAIPEALTDRFEIVFCDYPPLQVELQILQDTWKANNGEDIAGVGNERFFATLVELAATTRRMWQDGELSQPVSTRSLVNVTRMLADADRNFNIAKNPQHLQALVITLFNSLWLKCSGIGEDYDWEGKRASLQDMLEMEMEKLFASSPLKKRSRGSRSLSTPGPPGSGSATGPVKI